MHNFLPRAFPAFQYQTSDSNLTYFLSSSSSPPDDLTDLRLLRLPVLLPPKLKAHLFLPALGLELGVRGVLIVFDLEVLDEGVNNPEVMDSSNAVSSDMAEIFSTLWLFLALAGFLGGLLIT